MKHYAERKPVIHYFWLRRFQMSYPPPDVVDTACGIEVPIERAVEYRDRATCRRCKKSRY